MSTATSGEPGLLTRERTPLRVLVVEDRPDDVELLLRALDRAGFVCQWSQVDRVSDVVGALGAAPELVICDYSLPDGDVLDVLALLRVAAPDLPVIVVSGVVDEQTVVESLREGAVDYLLKDRMARLGACVRRAVDEAGLRAATRRAQLEERETAGILRGLVRHSPAAIAVHTVDGKVLVSNQHFDRLLAAHPESVRLSGPGALPARAAEGTEQVWDGRTYWSVRYPVVDADGARYAVGSIHLDVTGVRETEAALRAARSELEARAQLLDEQNTRLRELDQLRSDLVASVTHDLRTPVSSIRGYAEVLREDSGQRLTAQDVSMLEVIDRNSNRLLTLIDDLLLLSNLDGSPAGRIRGPIAAGDLALAARDVLLPAADRSGVRLEVELAEDLPTLLGDREQLDRILINLVSNAVKFTPPGGRVTISASPQADGVSLVVADTGAGMSSEDLPRIFERFYRTSTAKDTRVQGTGLGLSVVKGIVEHHGGTISVQSELGVGTTVRVWLPVDDSAGGLAPAGVQSMAARFEDMAGGGSAAELELARGIVRRFPGKAVELIDALAGAAAAGDPAAARHAHSLGGAAALIGHSPLAGLGREAEEFAEAGQLGAVLDRVSALRRGLDDWPARLEWLEEHCPGFASEPGSGGPPGSPDRAITATP